MSTLSPLRIRSGQGDYTVRFVEEIQGIVAEVTRIPKAVFVVDRNVARLYAEVLAPILSKESTVLLDATEEEKTFRGVEKVGLALQKANASKQSTLVAFGGGIIQDICALTAHLYYRGIPWVFVPTTLLAQSDSCIGAKCGINLGAFKNQLGCFQSPAAVWISTSFTSTLSEGDVASGYGEILKLMVTGSEAHFRKFAEVASQKSLRNPMLPELIRSCLEIKQKVIEVDEYERDLRRILNYGHTFGHALETLTQYEVPHGLAVAWGMDLVNFISWKKGMLEKQTFERIHQLIQEKLPFRLSKPISAQALIDASRRDKKVADGQINLILLEKLGSLKIVKTPFDAELESSIQDYVANWGVFPSPK
jgi:3-dehydroquinate synthase